MLKFLYTIKSPPPSHAPINKTFSYLIVNYVELAFVYHDFFGRKIIQNLC